MKRFFAAILPVVLLSLNFAGVALASSGGVVINEVAWAGSPDSSGDEWIELYNTGTAPVDLAGWYIEDDGNAVYLIESGVIEPRSYFVLGDNEDVASGAVDFIVGLSLANTGDSLELFDANGLSMDSVNGSGDLWTGGNLTTKASMERIDPLGNEWVSAVSGNGSRASSGSEILGTPGSLNSVFAGSGANVSLTPSENFAESGDVIEFDMSVDDVTDLYAYGFDLVYDASALEFVGANEGVFLAGDGTGTVFDAELENAEPGRLVIGGARLISPASGIDGGGVLFSVEFAVVGADGQSAELAIGAASYLADSVLEMPAVFGGATVEIGGGSDVVSNLLVSEGVERGSLDLNWDEGAESYVVMKQAPDGSFEIVGELNGTSFSDSSVLPNVEYLYQVVAVRGNARSLATEIVGVDSRGVSGDVDGSDRVDGRDFEKLARAYGLAYGNEGYDLMVDLNYDGIIDGSDLIDIGSNFGRTYEN